MDKMGVCQQMEVSACAFLFYINVFLECCFSTSLKKFKCSNQNLDYIHSNVVSSITV